MVNSTNRSLDVATVPNRCVRVLRLGAVQCGTNLHLALPGRFMFRSAQQEAFLMIELMVAMAILLLAVFPVSYAVWHERQLSRACYNRAVAMEIVDGEIEVLAAGRWRTFDEGAHSYSVHAESATNLPPGRFVLTRTGTQLRLEWIPDKRDKGGRVSREVALR